jgi:hypothetical protein
LRLRDDGDGHLDPIAIRREWRLLPPRAENAIR